MADQQTGPPNDASLSLGEGLVKSWIERHGHSGFIVAPDFLLHVIQEVRAARAARAAPRPEPPPPSPRIVAVAICVPWSKRNRSGEGLIVSLPRPARHHDVLKLICKIFGDDHGTAHPDDQGFLTDGGLYVSRRVALHVAEAAGQLKPDRPKLPDLYSEDVW